MVAHVNLPCPDDASNAAAELDPQAGPADQKGRICWAVVGPKLLDALKAYVDYWGGAHDDDCPGDDTCGCSGEPINDAVNEAINLAEGYGPADGFTRRAPLCAAPHWTRPVLP